MRSFDEILEITAKRHGGVEAVEAILPTPMSKDAFAKITDDRILSRFAHAIFCSGFSWKVVDAKWDGHEAAFKGFDIHKVAMMDDDWFDSLLKDERIIRFGAKIKSVQENAVFLSNLAAEHGSAAKRVSDWPNSDFIGLIDLMKTQGSRLGGTTGPYALRALGRDGFILSRDVVARLVAEGVIDKPSGSKTAMRKVQEAFNIWSDQSGRGLSQVSRVLAMSIG